MTLKIKVIRERDNSEQVEIKENKSQKDLNSFIKVFNLFTRKGGFKGFAIYNADTNELLYKKGII